MGLFLRFEAATPQLCSSGWIGFAARNLGCVCEADVCVFSGFEGCFIALGFVFW